MLIGKPTIYIYIYNEYLRKKVSPSVPRASMSVRPVRGFRDGEIQRTIPPGQKNSVQYCPDREVGVEYYCDE